MIAEGLRSVTTESLFWVPPLATEVVKADTF